MKIINEWKTKNKTFDAQNTAVSGQTILSKTRLFFYSLRALEWSGFLIPLALSLCNNTADDCCLTKYTAIEKLWSKEKTKTGTHYAEESQNSNVSQLFWYNSLTLPISEVQETTIVLGTVVDSRTRDVILMGRLGLFGSTPFFVGGRYP